MNSADVFRLWEKIGVPGENPCRHESIQTMAPRTLMLWFSYAIMLPVALDSEKLIKMAIIVPLKQFQQL